MTARWADPLIRVFPFPGDLVCDLSGIEKECDHRQVLRSFINTIVWGAIASAIAIRTMV